MLFTWPPFRQRSATELSLCIRIPALALASIVCLGAPVFLAAQQPASQGYYDQSPPEINAPGNSAEANAYSAALSQQDPVARQVALRRFLQAYPSSSLRQAAMTQMMLALRQAQGGAAQPIVGSPLPKPSAIPGGPPPARTSGATAQTPDSLLQRSPTPAQVKVAANSLSIKADNSTLSQILHEVSRTTGMKVDGLSKDERIFGSYGPGEPREVLSALLDGSGYNVLMVGYGNDGAPRQLSLSQRIAMPAATTVNPAQPANDDEADESDQDIQQVPPDQNVPVIRPTGQPNEGSQQPRTPQQIIQELQRMRQQQDQNPPQPPQ